MSARDTKTYSADDIAKMVAKGDFSATAKRARQAGPQLDRAFWDKAHVVMPSVAPKVPISLRIDPEVLSWFKGSGRGYLSRMNAVLRAYVDAQNQVRG